MINRILARRYVSICLLHNIEDSGECGRRMATANVGACWRMTPLPYGCCKKQLSIAMNDIRSIYTIPKKICMHYCFERTYSCTCNSCMWNMLGFIWRVCHNKYNYPNPSDHNRMDVMEIKSRLMPLPIRHVQSRLHYTNKRVVHVTTTLSLWLCGSWRARISLYGSCTKLYIGF